jgi:hypothetical protein
MMNAQTRSTALWVAYGAAGVVGMIRHRGDEYTVTMAGADAELGSYPSMDVAKNALHAHMHPGADWPTFREH